MTSSTILALCGRCFLLLYPLGALVAASGKTTGRESCQGSCDSRPASGIWLAEDAAASTPGGDGLSMLQRAAQTIPVQPFDMHPNPEEFEPADAEELLESVKGPSIWWSPHPPKCTAQIVVNIGLPRTGTVSFTGWAHRLGFHGVHHRSGVTSWRADGYKNFYKSLPEGPAAFADSPWVYEACMIASRRPKSMPESKLKFISIGRNSSAWLHSVKTMMCIYGGGFTAERCDSLRDVSTSMSHGESLVKLPGEFDKVANSVSYHHRLKMFKQWLKARWCRRAENANMSPEKICEAGGHGIESEGEAKMAAKFMKQFQADMESCVGKKNVLHVRLEDPKKERKMAKFLGCKGRVPQYPAAGASKHVFLMSEQEEVLSEGEEPNVIEDEEEEEEEEEEEAQPEELEGVE
mmetsp:Transcript_12956/g.30275  ORF Transcript_12956/g.30275 Transcript_12956/m.30275 type:complete len:406 (+) Transcript_12956:46-1263(+)